MHRNELGKEYMKQGKNVRCGIALGLSMIFGSFYAGPHEIQIEGDLIVKEGTQAEYKISVKNVSKTDFVDLVINVESFSESCLAYCSTTSQSMQWVTYQKNGFTCVESTLKKLRVNESASLTIKTKACSLEMDGDLRSQNIKVIVKGENVRRGTKDHSVTVYKL